MKYNTSFKNEYYNQYYQKVNIFLNFKSFEKKKMFINNPYIIIMLLPYIIIYWQR